MLRRTWRFCLYLLMVSLLYFRWSPVLTSQPLHLPGFFQHEKTLTPFASQPLTSLLCTLLIHLFVHITVSVEFLLRSRHYAHWALSIQRWKRQFLLLGSFCGRPHKPTVWNWIGKCTRSSQLSILHGSLVLPGDSPSSLTEHARPPMTWPRLPQQFHLLLFLFFHFVLHAFSSTCCSPAMQLSLSNLVFLHECPLSRDVSPSPVLSYALLE